nr:hypothetical protein GCM10020093_044360 [Planobispora longispora]
MKRIRMAAALVPLAVLTACGQAPKAEVATAGSTASSTGPSASPSASAQEDGVKYAQCMRENGIDMPDPEPGGERVKIAGKVDKNKFDKAHKACQKYAPKAMRGPVDDPGPATRCSRSPAACGRTASTWPIPTSPAAVAGSRSAARS